MLAFFLFRGSFRGFIGELISLVSLAVSVFCGWTFAQPLAAIVLHYAPDWHPLIVELVCAVFIFIAVSLFFAMLGRILQSLIKMAKLGFMDYILGAVFGFVRAFVVVLFIYGVITIFPVIPSDWMEESLAMQGAAAVWPSVYQALTSSGLIDLSRLTPQTW